MDGRSTTRIRIQIPKPGPGPDNQSVQYQRRDRNTAPLQIDPPNQIVCSLPSAAVTATATATATQSSSSTSPRFQLPEGWIVEERPRRRILPGGRGTLADKYYIEPGRGGRRFRSLSAVKRYLTEGEEYVAGRRAIKPNNMQIVPSISDGSSQLGLPCGWLVESRPRSNASRFDKYYIEPGTGRRFRSLTSVQRYLTEGEGCAVAKPKMIKPRSDQNNMQIVPIVADSSPELGLPYGWLVELRRRSDGSKFDRYYIEPGTGRKFRSLVSAQRYIQEAVGFTATLKAIISVDDDSIGKKFTGKLKIKSLADVGENDTLTMPQHPDTKPLVDVKDTGALRRPSLPTSPTRVKWIFDGEGENTWRPSIDDSLVPNSEMQEWSEAFVVRMDSQ